MISTLHPALNQLLDMIRVVYYHTYVPRTVPGIVSYTWSKILEIGDAICICLHKTADQQVFGWI